MEFESLLRSSQCEKLNEDYASLLGEGEELKEKGEFIKALDEVNRAVELVLDDTVCDINDNEAWYFRAVLEYPVEYVKRKRRAWLNIPGDAQAFIREYQALGEYYRSMGLKAEGVEHEAMFDIVMEQQDKAFLQEMLAYYTLQKEKEHVSGVMTLLWRLHHSAPNKVRQEKISAWFARQDIKAGCKDPIRCLNDYVPVNSSFKTFRYNYKLIWVKESGSAFRHLSLFLKNKSSENK
jgi:hypothetical protein